MCCYLSEGVVITLDTVTRDVVAELTELTGLTAEWRTRGLRLT